MSFCWFNLCQKICFFLSDLGPLPFLCEAWGSSSHCNFYTFHASVLHQMQYLQLSETFQTIITANKTVFCATSCKLYIQKPTIATIGLVTCNQGVVFLVPKFLPKVLSGSLTYTMEIGAPTPVQAPAFFTEMVRDAKPGLVSWLGRSGHQKALLCRANVRKKTMEKKHIWCRKKMWFFFICFPDLHADRQTMSHTSGRDIFLLGRNPAALKMDNVWDKLQWPNPTSPKRNIVLNQSAQMPIIQLGKFL